MGTGPREAVGLAQGSWATTPAIRRSMQTNRPRDTRPERALRSAMHRLGLRFRKHRRLPVGFLARADAAFPRERVAVFLDGCFWHGCPEHGRAPQAHAGFWAAKIRRNQEHDRRVDAALAEAGWAAVRVWEHENPVTAAERVAALVRARRAMGMGGRA